MGLVDSQISSVWLMTIHFDPVIRKKQAITYIDDTIKQSQNKNEMFTVINEYYTLHRKASLKKQHPTKRSSF